MESDSTGRFQAECALMGAAYRRGKGLKQLTNRQLIRLIRDAGLKPERRKMDNIDLVMNWKRKNDEALLFRDSHIVFWWMYYDRSDSSIGYVVTIHRTGHFDTWLLDRPDRPDRKAEMAKQRQYRQLLGNTSRHFGGTVWKRGKQWETRATTIPGFHFQNFGDLADFVEFNQGRRPVQYIEYPRWPIPMSYAESVVTLNQTGTM